MFNYRFLHLQVGSIFQPAMLVHQEGNSSQKNVRPSLTFLDLFKALSESSHALLCAARMEPQGNTVGFRKLKQQKH